jgi:hypothetical protein
MKIPAHFSLRSLLFFMAIFACYFPCERAYREWYNQRYAKFHFKSFLGDLYNGMSLAEIKSWDLALTPLRSGNLAEIFEEDRIRIRFSDGIYYVQKSWFEKQVQGLKEGQELYFCKLPKGPGSLLRFVDGKLVGHRNRPLTKKVLDTEFLPSEIPSPSLRFGLFPLYFTPVLFLIGLFAIRPIDKLRKLRNFRLFEKVSLGHGLIDSTWRYKFTHFLFSLFRTR